MTFFQRTTIAPQARRLALAATTALALSLAATAGIAQPAGPMMHGGPGMHGAGAGFEQMIPRVLAQAKASLNLDTGQQATWDSLVAQGKAARDAARANRQKVKDALVAALATTAPDLGGVAAVADTVEQQNRDQRKALRNQWLDFYTNSLTADQKLVIRDLLQKKVAQAESFHQRMLERIQQHVAPSGS